MAQRRRLHPHPHGRGLKVGGTGRLAAIACGGAAAIAVAGVLLNARATSSFEIERSPASDQAATSPTAAATNLTTCVVHVDGAVAHPGVYTLTGDIVRVRDAVDAAGGLLEDANTDGINLASPLVDGSKVHIPQAAEPSEGTDAQAGEPSSSSLATLVNINTADEAALDTLPGVGASTASAIVKDREQSGPFTSVEDIMRVSGIGEKKFEKIRDLICV